MLAVYEKLFPYSRFPLLKEVPSSDVTVCAIASLFVQVTVDPTLTEVVAGKDMPEMEIALGLLLLLFPPVDPP